MEDLDLLDSDWAPSAEWMRQLLRRTESMYYWYNTPPFVLDEEESSTSSSSDSSEDYDTDDTQPAPETAAILAEQ